MHSVFYRLIHRAKFTKNLGIDRIEHEEAVFIPPMKNIGVHVFHIKIILLGIESFMNPNNHISNNTGCHKCSKISKRIIWPVFLHHLFSTVL